MSSQLDGMASCPHSLVEWPHVLMSRWSDNTFSELDRVASRSHNWAEWPHVLTAGQSYHTSSQLDRMASCPHSCTELPHVLTAGRSGLMSSQLDRVAWLLCWAHQGTEAGEEGGGSNALVLLVIQLSCSRDYDLGGRCTSALEEPLFPKDLGGHPGGGRSCPDCRLMQQQQGGFLQPVRLPEQT